MVLIQYHTIPVRPYAIPCFTCSTILLFEADIYCLKRKQRIETTVISIHLGFCSMLGHPLNHAYITTHETAYRDHTTQNPAPLSHALSLTCTRVTCPTVSVRVAPVAGRTRPRKPGTHRVSCDPYHAQHGKTACPALAKKARDWISEIL